MKRYLLILMLLISSLTEPVMLKAAQPHPDSADTCRDLDPSEFFLELNQAAWPVVIDTRSWAEFRRERIPGALLAESREALERIADTLDRDQPIFLYCEFDDRSSTACSLLVARGFQRVYNLRGGILAWKEIPYETDRRRRRKR